MTPSTPTTTPRTVDSLPQGHRGLWGTLVRPGRTPTVHRCLNGRRPWVARRNIHEDDQRQQMTRVLTRTCILTDIPQSGRKEEDGPWKRNTCRSCNKEKSRAEKQTVSKKKKKKRLEQLSLKPRSKKACLQKKKKTAYARFLAAWCLVGKRRRPGKTLLRRTTAKVDNANHDRLTDHVFSATCASRGMEDIKLGVSAMGVDFSVQIELVRMQLNSGNPLPCNAASR